MSEWKPLTNTEATLNKQFVESESYIPKEDARRLLRDRDNWRALVECLEIQCSHAITCPADCYLCEARRRLEESR